MRTFPIMNPWKYLSFALIGIIGLGVLTPQASAATKEIHQQIIDALSSISGKTDNLPPDPADQSAVEDSIDAQDRIVPIHFDAMGNNIENLRLTPTSEDGYSGRISFSATAGDDINADAQYTAADCDAKIRIDYDTDNNDVPDTLGMNADLKGGLPTTGFITILSGVDGIYLSITDMSASESCQGTVILLLSETVT